STLQGHRAARGLKRTVLSWSRGVVGIALVDVSQSATKCDGSAMALGRKTGGGSRKGIPNNVTAHVRQAIAAFAEDNVGKLQTWLDAVAEKDPAKAADLFVRVLEYHVPKLARSEVTQEVREEPQTMRIVFVPPPERTDEADARLP